MQHTFEFGSCTIGFFSGVFSWAINFRWQDPFYNEALSSMRSFTNYFLKLIEALQYYVQKLQTHILIYVERRLRQLWGVFWHTLGQQAGFNSKTNLD